jgi:ABC-type transport system involved in multi-copper enzyme maturation permease subunit
MIRKELRQRMRERRAWLLPSLYLVLLGAGAVLAYVVSLETPTAPSVSGLQGADLGTALFLTAVYAQLAILLIVAAVFSAGAITMEKEQRTLAGLLTSLLSPAEIWWGKFVAALLFQALLLVAGLPVLALAFAFGGIGWREVAVATGTTLGLLAAVSAVGLACSAYFRRTVHAAAVTYAVVLGLTALTAIAYALLGGDGEDASAAPLYLNPFYALSAALFPDEGRSADWLASMCLFTALGVLAAALAIRAIGRSGEQS